MNIKLIMLGCWILLSAFIMPYILLKILKPKKDSVEGALIVFCLSLIISTSIMLIVYGVVQ